VYGNAKKAEVFECKYYRYNIKKVIEKRNELRVGDSIYVEGKTFKILDMVSCGITACRNCNSSLIVTGTDNNRITTCFSPYYLQQKSAILYFESKLILHKVILDKNLFKV
jgi:hypothetical protein